MASFSLSSHRAANQPSRFRLPSSAHIGKVKLAVSKLGQSIAFYTDALGRGLPAGLSKGFWRLLRFCWSLHWKLLLPSDASVKETLNSLQAAGYSPSQYDSGRYLVTDLAA